MKIIKLKSQNTMKGYGNTSPKTIKSNNNTKRYYKTIMKLIKKAKNQLNTEKNNL